MRTTSWLKTGCFGLFVAGLSALATGCGGSVEATGKVKGRVKFFDKYLTAGTVTFTTKDGRVVRAVVAVAVEVGGGGVQVVPGQGGVGRPQFAAQVPGPRPPADRDQAECQEGRQDSDPPPGSAGPWGRPAEA